MNKRTFKILLLMASVLMPLSLFAQQAEEIKNFLQFSVDNPFLPVILLIGIVIACFSFFFPRFGLFVMLFFMLISTDMQMDQSTQGRGATIRIEDIVLILVSGGWLLNRAKSRSLTMFRHVPVNKPVLMMAFVIVIASIVGYLQGTLPFKRGLLFTLKRLEYFWLFFMTLNIMERDREVKNVTLLLVVLTIAVSIVGAVQFFIFPLSGLTGGGATATAGFHRANTLADFYLIVGGVFLGLFIYTVNFRKMCGYLFVLVLCTGAIIMTKSRGAYVSIPPLLITIIFVSKNKKVFLSVLIAVILIIFYVTGMAILGSGQGALSQGGVQLTDKHTGDVGNQFESLHDIATQGPQADSSFYARYSSWINGMDNIFEYPLLGHGVGSIPLSYFDCQHVREMYETGIIGYVLFLYMNLIIFVTVFNLFYMTDDPFTKGITCGFLGGHVGMLVHGWSIANFYTIMNMEVFWFIIAMIMVLYHNHMTRLQSEEASVVDMQQPELL